MRRLRFGRLMTLMFAATIANSAFSADILTQYKGKSIAAWVAALRKPTGEFDPKVMRVVAELGPEARAAVPVLIEALNDREHYWEALNALRAIGPDARAAVPKLIERLRKHEGLGYPAFCRPLSAIGEPAVPALKALMKDKKVGYRAAQAIGDMGDAGMDLLIAALSDPDAAVRANAATALESMDPGPVEALAALRNALSDGDEEVRRSVASALRAIGKDAADAVPELTRAVQDPSTEVRLIAVRILDSLGSAAATAVPALIKAADDKSEDVREAAIHALGSVGQGSAEAAQTLHRFLSAKQKRYLRTAAVWALGRHGEHSAAMLALLSDEHPDVRWAAAWALAGASPEKAALIFRERLRSDSHFRWEAAAGLKLTGKHGVGPLIETLRDTDWYIRTLTVESLADMGPAARAAVPALVDALKDKDPSVRYGTADALTRIEPGNQAALSALVAALSTEDLPHYRFETAKLLGRFGSSVRPQIVAALRAAKPGARATAVCALAAVEPGTRETIGLLLAAVADKDAEVRRCAVLVLIPFAATDAQAAVGPLTVALNDDNWEVRAGAAQALGRIGAPAKTAVPALIAALKEPATDGPRWKLSEFDNTWVDPVGEVRSNAAYALGRIGTDAKDGTKALVAALKDKHHQVSQAAAWGLARVGPDPMLCVPPLIAALESDADDSTKENAALALGEMGAESRKAVAALTDALRYGSRDLKGCAAWALGRIGPDAAAAAPVLARYLDTPEPISGRIDYGRQTGFRSDFKPPEPQLPEVRPLLRREDRDGRIEAAAALRLIRREP